MRKKETEAIEGGRDGRGEKRGQRERSIQSVACIGERTEPVVTVMLYRHVV